MEAVPGYLSLHQTADVMTLKWTPNQLMNGSVGDLDYEKRWGARSRSLPSTGTFGPCPLGPDPTRCSIWWLQPLGPASLWGWPHGSLKDWGPSGNRLEESQGVGVRQIPAKRQPRNILTKFSQAPSWQIFRRLLPAFPSLYAEGRQEASVGGHLVQGRLFCYPGFMRPSQGFAPKKLGAGNSLPPCPMSRHSLGQLWEKQRKATGQRCGNPISSA